MSGLAGGPPMHRMDSRLLDREAQDRNWAAPMPDVTALPRVGAEPRLRFEWETRDTVNNRLWDNMVEAGPKTVTSAGLAEHISSGALVGNPAAARQDHRPYRAEPEWGRADRGRPMGGPPGSLFQNAWLDGFDVESPGTARELRGTVRETHEGRSEGAASRILDRTFQHHWMAAGPGTGPGIAQIDASERLRPDRDDWRQAVRR